MDGYLRLTLIMEEKMYTTINFKTKKALKEAVKAGEKVTVFQSGPFGSGAVQGSNGNITVYLEGPHYPAPHAWYATAVVKDGIIISVK